MISENISSSPRQNTEAVYGCLLETLAYTDYLMPFAIVNLVNQKISPSLNKFDNSVSYFDKREKILNEKFEELNLLKNQLGSELNNLVLYKKQLDFMLNQIAKDQSIKGAYKQFNQSKLSLRKGKVVWGLILASSLLLLILFILYGDYIVHGCIPTSVIDKIALNSYSRSEIEKHYLLNLSAMKYSIIVLLGLLATYAGRILKSLLHLSEQVKYRINITNSVIPFSTAMFDTVNKDAVMQLLVKEVASMGHTGMIPNEQDSFQGHSLVNQFLLKERIE